MLAQTRLLTVREVALTLRQSERTVRDKIASGDLAALRIGSGPRAPILREARRSDRMTKLFRAVQGTGRFLCASLLRWQSGGQGRRSPSVARSGPPLIAGTHRPGGRRRSCLVCPPSPVPPSSTQRAEV